MPRMIDTHAHLSDVAFTARLGGEGGGEPGAEPGSGPDEAADGRIAQVLDRARTAGVRAVVTVGETLADARANVDLAQRFPGVVLPAAGLFPTILDLEAAGEMANFIRSHAADLIAVGEVGLDRWKVQEEPGRALQRRIFSDFIDLALELDLPLNVHSRSAGRHAIEMLLERGAKRVQLHAFDGKASRALPAVEAGYYFSVPPSVVRSPQKQKLVRRLPLECMLLETDSPVLGPDPDVPNEPANALVSLEAIAAIKGLSASEVAEQLWENSCRLYGARVRRIGLS